MLAQDRLGAQRRDVALHRSAPRPRCRASELVDRDHHRHPELDLTLPIWRPRLAQPASTAATFSAPRSALATPPFIFIARTVATITAASGFEAGLAALDVEEFLCAKIGAETGFGNDKIGKLERRCGRHHRVAAMGDIGKRPAMHEGGIVFHRLHQIGLHRVFQQHRHRTIGLDVAAIDRRLVAAVGHHDRPQPLLQILEIPGQAQDRHHFRCDRDVEPGLARKPVGDAAEIDHDVCRAPGRSCPSPGARRCGAHRFPARCPSRCGCRSSPRADCARW